MSYSSTVINSLEPEMIVSASIGSPYFLDKLNLGKHILIYSLPIIKYTLYNIGYIIYSMRHREYWFIGNA